MVRHESGARMETQLQKEAPQTEFSLDSAVIYTLHGKCKITQIDTRTHEGNSIQFYKLEVQKSPLARTNRSDPAIWVPVSNSRNLGLRAPITRPEAEEVLKVISSKDSFYSLSEPWHLIHTKLEAAIRAEGCIGLGKVFSYLYVLKRKLGTLPKDPTKFYELVHKLLFRELSEALEEAPKAIEDKLARSLKNKPVLDS